MDTTRRQKPQRQVRRWRRDNTRRHYNHTKGWRCDGSSSYLDGSTHRWILARTPTVHRCPYEGRPWVAQSNPVGATVPQDSNMQRERDAGFTKSLNMVAEQSHAQESPQRAARHQHRRGGTTQHTTRIAPHQEKRRERVRLSGERQAGQRRGNDFSQIQYT